ncbi:NAD-dependent epimerase/dehydratase family protein [Marinagarivorans cellulosilyticus]|uniref:UDP-glucose 4-epimerase n=1 Tax=Marinagarivorans cellulosilyticus TaxID=2721545 RepID=A0AAN2BKP8_9GAMM|nr:NAD-dependent epimerase/dehydratase family protein [Marinagarivorans cellulosilyticus]BCD98207.1 UDP-glucose 4-epimerase [Marinagarivorans cellulosilyticus]
MAIYLVTGGCGYLGSRLVSHLIERGHYVRVLDNLSHGIPVSASDCMELNVGDVCNAKTVEQFMQDVDGCFHLADMSEYGFDKNNFRDIKATLTGGFNVFSAAAKTKTKVVYVSSSAVYGDNAELPLSEYAEPCPLTPYAADKRALEIHAKVASLMEGVQTVGLRLFNVYGERYEHEYQSRDVVTQFIMNALQGKSMTIYGDGEQSRDYVHVDDAVKFLMAAMDYSSRIPDIFNICSGEGVTVNALAQRIMCLANAHVAVNHKTSRSGDIYGSVGCPAKAAEKLNCSTSISLNKGLSQLIAFYRKQLGVEMAQPLSPFTGVAEAWQRVDDSFMRDTPRLDDYSAARF